MANLNIFLAATTGLGGRAPVRQATGAPLSSVAIGASSAATAGPLSAAPAGSIVTLQADADCYVCFGYGPADPTATTSCFKLKAGVAEDFGIEAGARLAVIAAA